MVAAPLSNTFLRVFLENYSKWIAFTVFLILGIKTIYDFLSDNKTQDITHCNCDNFKCLTTLAIATSIDAFLIGTVLGIQKVNLLFPILAIGIITFINSMIGCFLGNKSVLFLRQKSRIVA